MTTEDFEDWLRETEIPIEAETDKELFRQWLTDQIGEPSEAQLETAWETMPQRIELGERGIRGVRIEYPWGVEIRYGIQGIPGLWGWSTVRQIMEAEE